MQRQVGSVFSRSGARFFSAMVIVSILFSVLPAFSPPAAKAQEGGVATYIAEVRECPPGFDPAASDASTALANCDIPMAGVRSPLATPAPLVVTELWSGENSRSAPVIQ